MSKLPVVDVGIAAYQSEKNITALLHALCSQEEHGFTLRSIVVHCDGHTDQTATIVRKHQDPRVSCIVTKKRAGFGPALQTLTKKLTGDIVVLLNDDIQIRDKAFLSALVDEFRKEPGVGLVSGHLQPLKTKTFIERAALSAFRAFEAYKYADHDGHNKFTCDGKILALSRRFREGIAWPTDPALLGCVDLYLYLLCLQQGFRYRNAKKARVWFRLPQTLRDYIRLTTRNNATDDIVQKTFGDLAKQECTPGKQLLWYKLRESVINPVGALTVGLLSLYIKVLVKGGAYHFSPTWKVVKTTKELDSFS